MFDSLSLVHSGLFSLKYLELGIVRFRLNCEICRNKTTMTTEQQTDLLGFDKLNVLDRLNIILPNFYVTGSVSLVEYGVVSRPIHDLDICVRNMDLCYRLIDKGYTVDFDFDYEQPLPKDSVVQLKGKIANRAGVMINGIPVCIFYVKDEEETKMVEFMCGRRFQIAHPRYAIGAKRGYLLNLNQKPILTAEQKARKDKHQADVDAFEEWLKLGNQ